MRKWIFIGIAIFFLFIVLLLAKCNNDRNEKALKQEPIRIKQSTIDYGKQVALDSIAIERMQDSIEVLNNMIKNNVQQVKYIKVKAHEKANNVSKWSSAQYNEFLSERYKNRK